MKVEHKVPTNLGRTLTVIRKGNRILFCLNGNDGKPFDSKEAA
jgi:hypothetical protein